MTLPFDLEPARFGPRALPVADRIRANVAIAESGCWLWQRRIEWNGYTNIKIRGRKYATHRVAYVIWKGPIPNDLTVDHRCHNEDLTCLGGSSCPHRRCVNPDHLQLATSGDNTRASRNAPSAINAVKAVCVKGHSFDATNTYADSKGSRQCRTCKAERQRASRGAQSGRPVVPRSKTHCPKGHAFDEENTRWRSNGYRTCRTCQRARDRARTRGATRTDHGPSDR